MSTTAFESCKTITIQVTMMQLYTLHESFKNGGEMQNLWNFFIQNGDEYHLAGFVRPNIPVIQVYDAKID